jgi:hypothetical protein
MDRDEKIQKMVENYIQKRDRSKEVRVMEFHRDHLLLFLNRFRQLSARFATPSSSLLSHDIFLVVEAATTVAKSDLDELGQADSEQRALFSKYFDAFDKLTSGLVPLGEGAARCVEALERGAG